MKVLITNASLERRARGGTQGFIQDLARSLQKRGHSVMAYTSDPTQSRRLLHEDKIPVATDLENLEFVPDVIHGQHHLDAMSAITALPNVPAIYHSHGSIWKECLPLHPQIYQYVTVSRFQAERHLVESNLSAKNITVIPNGIEIARFPTVRDLPDRPKTALVYNRAAHKEHALTQTIETACRELGIKTDIIGLSSGNTIDNPEEVLPTYDVVFASGLSAMDAIACGCAVSILGRESCGSLVTDENFDRFREANFTIPANATPTTVADITRELSRYSADATRKATARMRCEGDFETVVDQLVDIYEKAITMHRENPPDPRLGILAVGDYLQTIVPLVKVVDDYLTWEARVPLSTQKELIDLQEQLILIEEKLKKHQ
ncbi:MAG: glycosyltransferase [Verrucomicrobiota bacterium]